MTLPSWHRIRKSSPCCLRRCTLPLGHGGSPHYWIFKSERVRNILFFETWRPEWDLKPRSPTFQAGSFNHCTRAPALGRWYICRLWMIQMPFMDGTFIDSMPVIDGSDAIFFGWYIWRLLMVHMLFIFGSYTVYLWNICRLFIVQMPFINGTYVVYWLYIFRLLMVHNLRTIIDGTFDVYWWYICRLLMVHMPFINGTYADYRWYICRLLVVHMPFIDST